jgi:hypothetical protein
MELIFEESLPASLYQYATGNTKKVQAERALKFFTTIILNYKTQVNIKKLNVFIKSLVIY